MKNRSQVSENTMRTLFFSFTLFNSIEECEQIYEFSEMIEQYDEMVTLKKSALY